MNAPKISVIIPLYNAEKFIRQTLISVLANKFADYEVIVVDDCSTDNSVAEVEKLIPHFESRLKIFHTEKNSGGAGVPRNIGIEHAAGKYVTFLDADDFLLPTALADFFNVAEKFQADAVHTEKIFIFKDTGNADFKREDLTLKKFENGAPVEVPTLEPDDLREKLQRCLEGKFLWMIGGKFYRRDFLRDNRIIFSDMPFAEDFIFCFKSLRVPAVTNIYRMNNQSASKRFLTAENGVKMWLSFITENMGRIFEFLNEREDFRHSSELQYLTAKFIVETHFKFIENLFICTTARCAENFL